MELAALEKVKSARIKNQDDSLTEADALVCTVLSPASSCWKYFWVPLETEAKRPSGPSWNFRLNLWTWEGPAFSFSQNLYLWSIRLVPKLANQKCPHSSLSLGLSKCWFEYFLTLCHSRVLLFFFQCLCIDLFTFGCAGSSFLQGLFSVTASQGYSSYPAQAPPCGGFSFGGSRL